MKRLFSLTLMAATLLISFRVSACEKHINGHHNSADTSLEANKK